MLLVVWPGAPSGVLAPSSKSRRPGAKKDQEPLVASLLLVVRPGATSSPLLLVALPDTIPANFNPMGLDSDVFVGITKVVGKWARKVVCPAEKVDIATASQAYDG